MQLIFGLPAKIFVSVNLLAILGLLVLPGVAALGWIIGCLIFAGQEQWCNIEAFHARK